MVNLFMNLEQVNGELFDEDIAEAKIDELKKVEDFHMYKEFENADGDRNGVQIIAKHFQEPKQVPSDSSAFDDGVLRIEQ